MTFDVSKVRAAYPALADGYAYLDGAAGTQLPDAVIDAISAAYRGGLGNAGGAFPASGRSDAAVRWADVDLPAGELPAAQFGELVSERTRLVAVTAASNVLGTRPDVTAITAI